MKYILGFLFLLTATVCFAQSEDDDDERILPKIDDNFQKYLDDGQKSGANGNVQVALTALVSGYLDIQYEHKLTPSLSLQASGAFQVNEGFDIIDNFINEYDPPDQFNSGFGYGGSIKYYAGQSAITKLGYASLTYRNRTSNYEDVKVVRNDIYYSTGLKYLFQNTLSADLSSGMGVRLYNMQYDENTSFLEDEKNVGFLWCFELKLGYYIKY